MNHSFKTSKGTELPIMVLKGKDYLEVKYRLVWFREERPTWSIETEFCSVDATSALAKATVRDESGRIIATSHKFEDKQGFADYREKAETGSIGRALALCGYGTQFTDDLDEGARIVDSPIARGPVSKPMYEQPGPGDGFQDDQYRPPFGQWKTHTLEQIYQEFGSERMVNYIDFLENSAKKKNHPLSEDGLEFIRRASAFIAAKEIAAAKEMGARQ